VLEGGERDVAARTIGAVRLLAEDTVERVRVDAIVQGEFPCETSVSAIDASAWTIVVVMVAVPSTSWWKTYRSFGWSYWRSSVPSAGESSVCIAISDRSIVY